MKNKKLRYFLLFLFLCNIVLSPFYVINANNPIKNEVKSNISIKDLQKNGIIENKNICEVSTEYETLTNGESYSYYKVKIKGNFYQDDIENLSFNIDNREVKEILNIFKKYIISYNKISVIDLEFTLTNMPTKITFNGKNINQTNLSNKDFNEMKKNIKQYINILEIKEFELITQRAKSKTVDEMKIISILLLIICVVKHFEPKDLSDSKE